MKLVEGFRICLLFLILTGLVQEPCMGNSIPICPYPKVVFFDDFDNGNYDGWTVERLHGNAAGAAVLAPDVVLSPEGYSVRGTGSGYGTGSFITHPVNLEDIVEVCIEMRAKSGPQTPNHASTYLLDGQDLYQGMVYGEGNRKADFLVGSPTEYLYRHDIGDRAYEWHTFAWCRDSEGWWSLCIDGILEAEDFAQDLQITSFDHVELLLHRNQSEIEWVRVTVPEPGTLLLLGLGGLGLLRKRRRQED